MPLAQKEKIGFLLNLLTIIGSAIAFIFTIYTWQDQNHIKRAEFLESRIKEFNDSSTYLAREISDGFAVRRDSTTNKVDKQIVLEGSSRDSTYNDIKLKNLDSTLSHLLPDTLNSRQRVRVSFDNLLDFFGKLEYYISLDLMKDGEVKYFEYYLNICARSPAIIRYANDNQFKQYLSLLARLKKTNKRTDMTEISIKIITSLMPLIAVIVGVWQFNKGQKENKQRQIARKNFKKEQLNRKASFETPAKSTISTNVPPMPEESQQMLKDVLMAMYQENATQCRHHELLRSTATGSIIAIDGVVLGLLTISKHINTSSLPILTFVIALGFFAIFFARKQYERFNFHYQRLRVYREKLDQLFANGIVKSLKETADNNHEKAYPGFEDSPYHIWWESLHDMIILIGVILMIIAIWFPQ